MENFEKNTHKEDAFTVANEMLLWSFIDGTVTETKKKEIEQLIASNAQWKEKYTEFMQLNGLLRLTETNQPSPGLAQNIMKQVAQYRPAPPIKSYINKKVLFIITVALLSLILILYIFVLQNAGVQGPKNDPVAVPQSAAIYNFFHSSWGRIPLYLLIAGNMMLGFYLLGRYLKHKKRNLL
jgi:hypothetical protein